MWCPDPHPCPQHPVQDAGQWGCVIRATSVVCTHFPQGSTSSSILAPSLGASSSLQPADLVLTRQRLVGLGRPHISGGRPCLCRVGQAQKKEIPSAWDTDVLCSLGGLHEIKKERRSLLLRAGQSEVLLFFQEPGRRINQRTRLSF